MLTAKGSCNIMLPQCKLNNKLKEYWYDKKKKKWVTDEEQWLKKNTQWFCWLVVIRLIHWKVISVNSMLLWWNASKIILQIWE
jgi:hypothetical protein